MSNIFGGGAVGLYLFLYILPGIFGTLVYEYIVEREPRDVLDRIGSSLVLALIGILVPRLIFGDALAPHVDIRGDTSPSLILDAFLQPKYLSVSTLTSILVAVAFAAAEGNGWLYAILRGCRLTKKTGTNDIWQQTFYLADRPWISLEFKDGRRVVGWPKLFSSSGAPRALLLGDATWYTLSEDGVFVEREVVGLGVYVANFDEIVSIEFLD